MNLRFGNFALCFRHEKLRRSQTMLRCPICKSEMRYKAGTTNGRKYEFYGCSRYPYCKGTVEMDEVDKYDDGVQPNKEERTIEEEGDDLRNTLFRDGYSWEEASYAKYMWEKD